MSNSHQPVSANIRASLYMMLAMMGFTVNDMFIKLLGNATGHSLGIGQIMAIRGAILLAIITFLIWQQKLFPRIRELFTRIVFARSLVEVCATLTFLKALQLLPFPTIASILQSLPLVVALGAALFLNEPIGWRRWIAIAIGFVGVIIIIRPGMGEFEPLSLLVLLSVLFAAARDLLSRRLPPALPSLLVSAATVVTITIAGVVITTTQDNWQTVNSQQVTLLTAAACFLFFGYQFIVLAMRTGEVAYVVPFRYTSLIWAITFGYLIFNEVPDTLTIVGSGIVIASGLFTLYREIINGRRAVTSTTVNSGNNSWHERRSVVVDKD